jgi:hypothetical protein
VSNTLLPNHLNPVWLAPSLLIKILACKRHRVGTEKWLHVFPQTHKLRHGTDMSEDTTEDLYGTQPTIQTVLERIDALSHNLNAHIDKLEDQVGIRLDRIGSEVKATHSEMFTLRADFKEFKIQFKEPA